MRTTSVDTSHTIQGKGSYVPVDKKTRRQNGNIGERIYKRQTSAKVFQHDDDDDDDDDGGGGGDDDDDDEGPRTGYSQQ